MIDGCMSSGHHLIPRNDVVSTKTRLEHAGEGLFCVLQRGHVRDALVLVPDELLGDGCVCVV